MNLEQVLNDKTLSALSFLLIGLWAWARHQPALSGEKTRTILATILRVACGFLLVFASFDKILDPAQFSKMMVTCYDILPAALVPLASVVIPWLEFFTGVCLIAGFKWRGAALLFCGLMALYSGLIVWDLFHGIDCNCGCFKMDSTEKMTWWTVLRDTGFFTVGSIVLISPRTSAALDELRTSDPS